MWSSRTLARCPLYLLFPNMFTHLCLDQEASGEALSPEYCIPLENCLHLPIRKSYLDALGEDCALEYLAVW